MKVLITGCNGFVGTYLTKELTEMGIDVWGIDIKSNSKQNIAASIMDTNALNDIVKQVNPDYVIHLAAIANVNHSDKSLIYDINFKGTLNLLNASIQAVTMPRFLYISSSLVYGNVPIEKLPIDETFNVEPVNHYGASKAAAEIAVKAFASEYGLEYVIVRPFNHTGVGQTENFVIPKMVNAFKRKDAKIELGNINTIRDFTDVRDVVRAYAGILNNFKNGEIYNLATGNGNTISNVIEKLKILSGHEMVIEIKDFLVRKSEVQSVIGDPRKIKNELGWKPNYCFDDTLNAMFHHEKNI